MDAHSLNIPPNWNSTTVPILLHSPFQYVLVFLASLALANGAQPETNLNFPIFRRSTNPHSPNRFVQERLKLLQKYVPQHGGTNSLQKRQISVPIISSLPTTNTSLSNATSTSTNSTSWSSFSTTTRGLSDGQGGVVGLQRTYNFQADLLVTTSCLLRGLAKSL